MEKIGIHVAGGSTGDYVTLGSTDSVYVVGRQDFEIECYVKRISFDNSLSTIISTQSFGNDANDKGFTLGYNNNGYFFGRLRDGTNAYTKTCDTAKITTDWQKVRAVFSLSTSTISFYIDDVLTATTASGTFPALTIANYSAQPKLFVVGHWTTIANCVISNLKITIAGAVVSNHYFNGNLYDLSGNGNHAVITGSCNYWGICSSSTRPIYATQADINGGLVFYQSFSDMLDIERSNGRMTGVGARCSITGGIEFTGGVPVIEYRCTPSMFAALPKLNQGVFTIMAKGVYKAGTSADQTLFTISSYGSNSASFECVIDNATTKLKLGSTIISETVAVENQLFHCALVCDVTNLSIKCYLNGVLDKTTTGQGMLAFYSPERLTVGAQPNKTSEKFYGCLGDMRIYNRALSLAEINKIISDGTL